LKKWTKASPEKTMLRSLNVLEEVFTMAKQHHDTDTMTVVAQAFAQISLQMQARPAESDESVKSIGFIHIKEEEAEDED
jgi:hypothetical protein